MKILLLNQTFYPDNVATSQQLADLAVFLNKKGHQVSVLTGQRGYEERSKKFSREEIWQGIHIRRVVSTGFGKSRFRYRLVDSFTFFFSLFVSLFSLPHQDLVISFTSPPLIGVFGAFFCWLKGGRHVQWLMDVNPDAAFQVGLLKRKSLLGKTLNAVFEKTLQSASQVVVLDRWMKKRMVEHGAKEENIVVVPPWSVLGEKSPSLNQEIQEFKTLHGLDGKFIVLYSGNHSVVHPLTTVLEAAKLLKDRKEVVFLFIGAGIRTQDVREFKEKHQLSNIIQLPLQPREKVKASFGSADLHVVVMGPGMSGLVHTSKIYSVLASGKPYVFVGPKESHVCDLLEECPTGFSVEAAFPNEILEAIQKTQQFSSEEKEKISLMSTQFVQRNFQPQTTLQSFYSSVIESAGEEQTESDSLSPEPATESPT